MPVPAIAAAAPAVGSAMSSWIPAIGGVLGGITGGLFSSSASKEDRKAQHEYATQGIRWKVEDAKRAGLHPLYALGGAGATYTPSTQPIMTAAQGAEIGQNLARTAMGATEHERLMQAAQLEAIRAGTQKDYALASAAASEAARNNQQANQAKPLANLPFEAGLDYWMRGLEQHRMFDEPAVGRKPSDAAPIGSVKIKPSEQVSRRAGGSHMEASDNPLWQEYEVAPGFRSLLPRSSDPSESLENLSIWSIPAVIKANSDRYGSAWTKDFLEKVYGISLRTPQELGRRNFPGGDPWWFTKGFKRR